MSSELDNIVQDFLVESHENLDHLDQALIALEADADPQERLAGIFRAIHTLKGTCGFLGFSRLEQLSHVGENLLSHLRDGGLSPTPPITDGLLRMLDSIRGILAHIEATGQEGEVACDDLIATLNQLQNTVASPVRAKKDIRPTTPAQGDETAAVDFDDIPIAHASADTTPLKLGEKPAGEKSTSSGPAADSAIRVDVRILDKLMVLVGELVLVRNRLQQHAGCLGTSPLVSSAQRLNWITTELQEAVMKTRMQPIGSIWSKYPRVVRDLSSACGKQVNVEMDGLETELDRSLIEAIKDPFIHLLRNAIDHGIEAPEVRTARGKALPGRIWLRAFHEGGQVNIDIADDGAGICAERVKQKAVERGLVTQERANRMNDGEAIRLIFCPGFSTAEQITSVSGRGVGMDVVKANIERMGGTIDVSTQPEIGTTIRIKIPLTLAIIPALIIGHGDARFAIPQVSLLELVRLAGNEAQTGIEFVHGAPVYRLRGQLLPLVYLARELRLPESPASELAVNILVVQADGRRFGLVVDDIFDSAEIVVKPLDKLLHGTRVFAGTTILGDGKLALILDILNIAKSARLISESQQHIGSHANPAHQVCATRGGPVASRQTLLVFQADNGGRMAIPLSAVTRLEEFPVSQIERIGNDRVVQYRGQILPLVDIASTLAGGPPHALHRDARVAASEVVASEVVSVVVSTENENSCGFVVERILDIVEQDVEVRGTASRLGVDYTAVIQGRITEVVDVAALRKRIESHDGRGSRPVSRAPSAVGRSPDPPTISAVGRSPDPPTTSAVGRSPDPPTTVPVTT